jgi:uncharacterized alkaline shock family protein YloU
MDRNTRITFSQKAIRSLIQYAFKDIPEARLVKPATVHQDGRGLEIELPVSLTFGVSIPEMVKQIRGKIGGVLIQMTRLQVRSIDIYVTGIDYPGGMSGRRKK